MHSPSRLRSLRSAGIAAILSAGLIVVGAPLAAFADDDGATGSVADTGTAGTSGGTSDDTAGQGVSSGAESGSTESSDTESGSTESGPSSTPAPQAPARSSAPRLLDVPATTHTVSGVTRDGYGRLLAGVPVTLNQRLGDGSAYPDGGYSEITTVFSTTSDSHGAFSFTVPDDDNYYILCLDMADDALYQGDRCDNGFEVNGADVTGLVGGLGWRDTPAPTPDNAASLTLTGLRAAGQTVTWNQAPDWSGFESETGFEMMLGASLWTVDGEFPDLQHSSPVETSHTLTAGDATSQVSVKHFYAADLPSPDAGWFTSLTLVLGLPLPSAPATDSDALRQQPRSDVTAPTSTTAGSSLAVAVGAAHNGETVDGWLYSTPTFLGQAVVANGVATFTLPAGMTGSHTVAVAAAGALIGWAPLTIAAGGVLAETGVADVVATAGLGTALLLGGALLLLAGRRRQAE